MAMVLTVIPIPQWAEFLRPEWVALVTLFWIISIPTRFGIGKAWMVGLFLDILRGTLLGQYAFAFALMAAITLHLQPRFKVYPLIQQGIAVCLIIGLYQLTNIWVKGVAGIPVNSWVLLSAISSMILWPVVFVILTNFASRFRVV